MSCNFSPVTSPLVGARGFSLIEMVVVMAILVILMSVAVPAYRDQITRSQRRVGVATLLEAMVRQEQHFVVNKQYATTLAQLGYGADPVAVGSLGEELPLGSPRTIYEITLVNIQPVSVARQFTLRATPVLAQARDIQCGVLEITSAGVKTAQGGAARHCW